MLTKFKYIALELLLSVGLDRVASRWWMSWHDDGSLLSTHWAVVLGEVLRRSGQPGCAVEMLRLHWKRDGDPLVALSMYHCLAHDGRRLAEGAALLKQALKRPMGSVLRQQVLAAYCLRLKIDGDYIGAVDVAKELYMITNRLRHDYFKTAALVVLSMAALKKGDPGWRPPFHELSRRPYASLAHRYFASEWRVLQIAAEDRQRDDRSL